MNGTYFEVHISAVRRKNSQYSCSLNHALDIEKREAGHAARESERVDCELCYRLVGARIRLVVENVHGAVSHLQEIDVAGDDPQAAGLGRELDAMLALKRLNVVFGEPDRDLDAQSSVRGV